MAQRCAIAEAKQRWSVSGRVTKNLLSRARLLLRARASEGTLSCWSQGHLQSLAPTPVSRRVDVRQAGRKNSCRVFITT
jgi:hypothetical protein